MFDVGDNVFFIFDAYAHANEVGADAGGEKFIVVHLAMGGAGRVEDTGAGIGDVGNDGGEFQTVHEFCSGFPSAFNAEGNDAARSVGEVFFSKFVLAVVFQCGEINPGDFVVAF